jgi:CRISPR-associated protein Csb2
VTTTLALRLPWGRYHATPWDKSANEAEVEWPPSPWRLLRALYSSWKTNCPDLDDKAVEALLEALTEPPRYLLPPFTRAHSRHYLPGIGHTVNRKKEPPERRPETTKTIDAFVVTARDAEVLIEWPNDLSDEALSVLCRLVDGLSYIGRADAIVEGRVERGSSAVEGRWLSPVDPGSGDQTTRLLSPEQPLNLKSLTQSPHQVRTERLLQPRSTRWVAYPTPVPATPSAVRRPAKRAKPTAVRFAVTGRPLPAKHAAVALGDMTRRTAMSAYGRHNDQAVSATLAGKDAESTPLGGKHQHAHYLSFSSSKGRSLDSVVVWAPTGFDDRELRALARRMEFFGAEDYDHTGGVSGRRLGVEAFGGIAEVAPELVTASTVWLSRTPYAPTRHWKGTAEEQLLADVSSELKFRGLPSPLQLELVRGDWLTYRRYRLKERINDARRAYGVRLVFEEPVAGPMCLGQLSHYGLGLFLPEGPNKS